MISHGYTAAAALAVLITCACDFVVFRTRILRSKLFWATYGIVLVFQLIVNGVLTGLDIVSYDPRVIIGVRLAYAPPEDIGFGFALVTLTLVLWVWRERAMQARRADRGAPYPSTNRETHA